MLLLDGQPPKYNIKNRQMLGHSPRGVKSQPEMSSNHPPPPLRISCTPTTLCADVESNVDTSCNKKDMPVFDSGNTEGILYCEDYAEIVENEEGDYSR